MNTDSKPPRARRVLAIALAGILAAFCLPVVPASAIVDAILAVVNNDVITYKDLQDYMSSVYLRSKLENRSDEEIKRILADLQVTGLQKLIQDKLILGEADRKDVKVGDKDIDEQINAVKSQYDSEQDFLEAITSQGYTLTDLRNKIKNQLKIQYVIEREVRANIHVKPQEVTDYYAAHKQEFQRPERVNLDSIFVAKTNPPDKGKQKIQEAFDQLQQGKDFKQVAKDYSEMCSVGIVAKGALLPDIEKTVFQLKTGQISPVVEAENGGYIFKLLGRIPRQIAPLDDVKNGIRDKIFYQKFQKEFSAWINQLKGKAYIEVKK